MLTMSLFDLTFLIFLRVFYTDVLKKTTESKVKASIFDVINYYGKKNFLIELLIYSSLTIFVVFYLDLDYIHFCLNIFIFFVVSKYILGFFIFKESKILKLSTCFDLFLSFSFSAYRITSVYPKFYFMTIPFVFILGFFSVVYRRDEISNSYYK